MKVANESVFSQIMLSQLARSTIEQHCSHAQATDVVSFICDKTARDVDSIGCSETSEWKRLLPNLCMRQLASSTSNIAVTSSWCGNYKTSTAEYSSHISAVVKLANESVLLFSQVYASASSLIAVTPSWCGQHYFAWLQQTTACIFCTTACISATVYM